MKLDIICYNKYQIVKRIVLILIYLLLITIIISIKGFSFEIAFFKWGLLLLLGLWLVLNWVIVPYNKLGDISIYKEGHVFLEQYDQHKRLQLSSLIFHYGGYKGEMHEYEIFYTGSWCRDGTKNFLEVNGEKYQVLINGQAEMDSLKSIINELQNQGIEAEFINEK